ncbi:hypothetical protein SVIOM74S_00790 [Streptomyces violarus]
MPAYDGGVDERNAIIGRSPSSGFAIAARVEGQGERRLFRGVADVVDAVGVFQVALRRHAGQGLLGDVGEDGVVRLRGVGEVVQRAALVREVHGWISPSCLRWP